MKGLTLEGNPMNVSIVLKPSGISTFKIIKGFALEANTMNVSNAGKPSGDTETSYP
jgi:hypothetical protein